MPKKSKKNSTRAHSEQMIFTICLGFILLLILHPEMRLSLWDYMAGGGQELLIGILVACGGIIAIRECLRNRKKSKETRATIAFFLVFLNLLVFAISPDISYHGESRNWMIFHLGLYCLNNGYLILQILKLRIGKNLHEQIAEEDALPSDIAVTSFVLVVLLISLEKWTHLGWNSIFTILNSYGLFLSNFVSQSLHRWRASF